MKSQFFLITLLLSTCIIMAQEKEKDPTRSLVSKGTFYISLNTNTAAGFLPPERFLYLHNKINPKINYFIFDKVSLGLSYVGISSRYPYAGKQIFYHNAEVELNYFLFSKKNKLIYLQTGLSYGQYNWQGFTFQKELTTNIKLGAGISWRLKKHPNLGINLEATYYINPTSHAKINPYPNISFGVSYFFNRKKKNSIDKTRFN